jgi:hypothetical protein
MRARRTNRHGAVPTEGIQGGLVRVLLEVVVSHSGMGFPGGIRIRSKECESLE